MNVTISMSNTTAATADPARAPLVVTVTVASLLTPAVVGTVLYPFVLAAIVRNRKEFSSPYYAYLFSISVCEIITLYYYGIYGVICVLCGACPVSQTFNRVLSAICGFTLWYLEFATDLIIAVDRFLAICFYGSYDRFTSRKWVTAMILTTWSIALALSMPMLTWVLPVAFFVDQFQANFENYTDAVNLFNTVSLDILFGNLALEALLYASCVSFLFFHRHGTETASASIRRAHRNLLLQSFLSITLLSSTVILTPYLNFSQVWPNYALAFLNQLVPMNRLFVALAMNSSIQAEVMKIVRCANGKLTKNAIQPAHNVLVAPSALPLQSLPATHSLRGQAYSTQSF